MRNVYALIAVTSLIAASIADADQSPVDVPIHVANARVNTQDLSVTYEFVNTAADVTAYELSITRHFADGSTLVSTQTQDWFESHGYTMVGLAAYSEYAVWLPPNGQPGDLMHLLSERLRTKAPVMYADVRLTAVIRLDGSAVGSRRVLERLFSRRVAMLGEYAYWAPRLDRAARRKDPQAALAQIVEALSTPKQDEVLPGPREALLKGASEMLRWVEREPDAGPRAVDAILKVATQQQRLLTEQSVWRR